MSDATGTLDPGDVPASGPWPDLGEGLRITAFVGAGAMGTVYRARDLRLDRDVAVKVLSAQFQSRPDIRTRFQREARTLALCDHPNIIQVHACSAPEARVPFMVMELVAGSTLQDVLERGGPAPWPVALEVVRQLLDGLAVVHERGVIHRDIKPGNVLVHNGTPKLADFGVAHTSDGTALTVEGRIVGTVRFLPPEAFSGAPPAVSLDVYAMGCLLYELLTGRAAFPQATTAEVMSAICRSGYAPLPEESLPAGVIALVGRALHPRPEQRFVDVREMAAACLTALAAEPPPDAAAWLSQLASGGARASVSTPPMSPAPRSTALGATLQGGAALLARTLIVAHGLLAALIGAALIGPVLTGYDPEGGSAVPAAGFLLAHAAAVLAAAAVAGAARLALSTGALVGAGVGLWLLRADLALLAEGTGSLAPWLARSAPALALTGSWLAAFTLWRWRGAPRMAWAGALLVSAGVVGAPLAADAWRTARLARELHAAADALPQVSHQARFARHEGLVLVAAGHVAAPGSWLALLEAGLRPIEPVVKAALPVGISTALHLAASDADLLADRPGAAPLSLYDGAVLARLDDLSRRAARTGGAVLLEAPAEVVSAGAARFFEAHTALTVALVRRAAVKVAVLPALTACAFLRGDRPRATRAELLALLRAEAEAVKRAAPAIEIAIQETADPDESLLDELAPQPWVDWVILRPVPGTVPVALLDETYHDLELLGVASKLALQTYMPFGVSRYWPWHEAQHGELVGLAARYVRARRLKGWIHAPIWAHREYRFRVVDRVPPLKQTAARAELDVFLKGRNPAPPP